MSVLAVFIVALATALATGLGVIPVMAVRANEHRAIALSSALAAGFMLGASAALFYEGVLRDAVGTGLGAIAVLASSLRRERCSASIATLTSGNSKALVA